MTAVGARLPPSEGIAPLGRMAATAAGADSSPIKRESAMHTSQHYQPDALRAAMAQALVRVWLGARQLLSGARAIGRGCVCASSASYSDGGGSSRTQPKHDLPHGCRRHVSTARSPVASLHPLAGRTRSGVAGEAVSGRPGAWRGSMSLLLVGCEGRVFCGPLGNRSSGGRRSHWVTVAERGCRDGREAETGE